jgi:hypothetical protein
MRRTDDSNSHTTTSEINFLRAAPMLIAERRFQKKTAAITPAELDLISDEYLSEWYAKYIAASKKRADWQDMNERKILAEAQALLKKYQ